MRLCGCAGHVSAKREERRAGRERGQAERRTNREREGGRVREVKCGQVHASAAGVRQHSTHVTEPLPVDRVDLADVGEDEIDFVTGEDPGLELARRVKVLVEDLQDLVDVILFRIYATMSEWGPGGGGGQRGVMSDSGR